MKITDKGDHIEIDESVDEINQRSLAKGMPAPIIVDLNWNGIDYILRRTWMTRQEFERLYPK